MSSLDQLSDDELEKLASGKSSDLSKLSDDDLEKIAGGKPSVVASALRKSAQGGLFGMSDEVAGWTEKTGRRFGAKGLGGPLVDVEWTGAEPTSDPEELEKAYVQGRDAERERLRVDSEVNPITSGVAEFGAAVLSPANKIAKGLSLAKGGALLGGLYGAGSSEGEGFVDVAKDTAMGAGTGAILGAGVDKLSKAIAPTASAVASKISPAVAKKNTKDIIAAADRMGIKVTPGMLDDTGFVERLEFTLANSPSMFGQAVKRNQNAVIEGLDDGVRSATKEASSLTPYQIGDKFKSGLTAKVGERLDPISAVFDDVTSSTSAIGITDKSKQAIINNIKKIPEVRLSGGKGKVGEYLQIIENIQTADDAKKVMTMLNEDIKALKGSERMSLVAIKEKVATIESKSINRAALTAAKEAGMRGESGKKIGKGIISDLKGARKDYRELAEDLTKIAENNRIKFQGPGAFLDRVEDITNEKIQRTFFNTENLRQLQNLKSKFPEEFNLLKRSQLQEIAEKSMKPVTQGDAGPSSTKFINEVSKLNDEVKQMLFGDSVQLTKDIETIQRSMPRNFNPSGTASQSKWSKEALASNFTDIPEYLLYKGASTNLGKKAVETFNVPNFQKLQNKTAGAIVKGQGPAVIGSSVAANKGVKGIERWMQNGESRLLDSDASLDKEFINQYKQSKDGKNALIRASDLKPGSNGLKQLSDQIKSSDEYKKFIKEKEKQAQGKEPDQASIKIKSQYPKIVRKDGFTAVVRSDEDLAEAKSEGWV